LEHDGLPQTIILSLPEATAGGGRRLVGATINRPVKGLSQFAADGFRARKIPAQRLLHLMRRAVVERIRPERADHAFLVARGGAAAQLAKATVVVVGAGAVGSEILRNLAALGVGKIRIVDPDVMQLDNVHRHVLGVHDVGRSKALSLTVELEFCFPHIDVTFRPSYVETVLASEPEYLLAADVIVLATGEETLERRLNRLLLLGPPRLHSWLEPLGLAGHAFACGGRELGGVVPRGCFECLYKITRPYGLFNRAALTAPGQEIRHTFAGCAGTFSPFSPLDARRTALGAADLAARVLTGTATMPLLASWRGLHSAFEEAGHLLSERALEIAPGAQVEVSGRALWRDDCPACGDGACAASTESNPGADASGTVNTSPADPTW
jgi:hypothetical protein